MTDQTVLRAKRDKVAAPPLSEQIARQVLKERGNPDILEASEIAEIRAEVKRRVALMWARAA